MSDEEIQPNYLIEMLGHPVQIAGSSSSIIAASVALALGGPLVAALPLIAYGSGLGLAAVFVPSFPTFRRAVDLRHRHQLREAARTSLLKNIQSKRPRYTATSDSTTPTDITWRRAYEDYGARYTRMRERLMALQKLARRSKTRLTEEDIERLDDASIDFLRLFYARVNLRERMRQDAGEVEAQLETVQTQLRDESLSRVDRRRMEQARQTLEHIAQQRSRLPGRDAGIAAQLISMSEAFEEIYHRLNTDPFSGTVVEYLNEATERLAIEDELEDHLDIELEEVTRKARAARASQRT